MKKTALITGATSGIGEATALRFAAEGWRVIITGRRNDRLTAVANRLKKEHHAAPLTLNFDIRDRSATKDALHSLNDPWRDIDLLVNNAGLAAGWCPIQEGKLSDWDAMIDTNIKGLLYISRLLMPQMITRGSGHIINVGSIAGKELYLFGNVYAATKFAVEALTRAMRIDLLRHRIRVTSVCPGLVHTEFSLVRHKGDPEKAEEVYEGFQPLVAEDVADAIFWAASRPDHVNINDIVIMPAAQADTKHIFKK